MAAKTALHLRGILLRQHFPHRAGHATVPVNALGPIAVATLVTSNDSFEIEIVLAPRIAAPNLRRDAVIAQTIVQLWRGCHDAVNRLVGEFGQSAHDIPDHDFHGHVGLPFSGGR